MSIRWQKLVLIKNLDDVVNEVKKNPNHVCSVLSNSFVRKRYPHLITDPDVLYIEHNILDFYEDRIEKLGSLDLLWFIVLYNQIIITLIIYV